MWGSSGLSGDTPDYPALFGENWRRAEQYADSQREEWSEIWEVFGVDAQLAEAVVFPEMVRWSALRDVMETAAVRALYQKRGSRRADFSIGRFQMKPSFAERMEREWAAWPESALYGFAFDTADTPEARRARIRRLDEPLWQCVYLAIFLRLLDERGGEFRDADPVRRVRLCAAAYNAGCGDPAEVRRLEEKRFFHTDFIAGPRTVYHSYGDIAAYYYQLRVTNYGLRVNK